MILSQDPTRRTWHPVYINHPDHIAVGEVVMRTINPDASTRLMFPELWTEERLEPHKPKALFLVNPTDADVFIDITDVMDLKVKALEAHASQIGDWPVGDFIRERNREIGAEARKRGLEGPFEYAEAYQLFRLEM